MHFTQLFILASLPFIASATPTPVSSKRQGASTIRIPLSKRGQTGSYRKRSTGSDPLTDSNEKLWFGTISVGTPPVDFTVDFDTGSSGLYLPGPSCSTSACSGHAAYDPSGSSTSEDLGQSGSLSYGDGSTVDGEVFTDAVTIAGLTATNQTLLAVTSSNEGASLASDGLLGMSPTDPDELGGATPFVQNLVDQGQLDAPVFAFKLSQSDDSELTIGGLDSDLYTGDITYVDVLSNTSWTVQMDDVSVDGSSVGSDAVPALIDSGTTLIVGDAATVDAVYSQIDGATNSSAAGYTYDIPCDFNQTVSLVFGGVTFDIDPTAFVIDNGDSSDMCLGGLISGGDALEEWIVGDVFMQSVYTVFDLGNMQVGFADLA